MCVGSCSLVNILPTFNNIFSIHHTAPVHVHLYLYYFPPQTPRVCTIFRVTSTLPCASSTALSCLSKRREVPDVDFQMSHIFSVVLFCLFLSLAGFLPLLPPCLALQISFYAILKTRKKDAAIVQGAGFTKNGEAII